jgi:NAD(P)-dependent dehydrogenase (short-subunit alcohol dehydrogenase family)
MTITTQGETMANSMAGKVALVTGAAQGIGRAIALAFAKEGCKVVVDDIQVEGGNETVAMIRAMGCEAIFVEADVSVSVDVQRMVNTAVDTFGRLDFAANNAGIEMGTMPMIQVSEEQWDRMMDVNLKGIFLGMKYEIPVMLKQGGGAIVNTSSGTGMKAVPGISPYVTTKHGINGLTKTAALEYAKQNIRINAVCPGAIKTPRFNQEMEKHPEVAKGYLAMMPNGRIGEPEEVAAAVVWLCSDAASLMNGVTMPVDGGVVAA